MARQVFSSKLKAVKGVMLDITGVLKDGESAIPGSVDAVERLLNSGLPIRLCTNETSCTRRFLVDKLHKLGFNIQEERVFSPVPALFQVLKERNLRPHLVVSPACLPDLKGIDESNPNCVVLGDAVHHFSYENLNAAFRLLMEMENPLIFSLGRGKYYQENGDLFLDVGPFLKAMEFATGVIGEIVGKPSPIFFNAVLQDMGMPASEVVMVGDDVVSDVGGAQACGMLGVQVRTGKFRPQDEPHPTVTPDAYVDNLAEFVDILLSSLSS